MKLRDRVLVGFCLSLVLVTVLFVVDLQNENARRQAAVETVVGGSGDGGGAGVGMHGRSRPSGHAQSAWDAASQFVLSTLRPSRVAPDDGRPTDEPPQTTYRRPAAPQPYPLTDHYPLPPVDQYADDRFDDLAERLSRPDFVVNRGNVADWATVRDVIVDDTYDDGTISNEYVVEYLENGLR